MKLLTDERDVMATNGDILKLTTHRVRVDSQQAGRTHLVSITLDAVASCGIETRSYPLLLGLALIAVVVPLLQPAQQRATALWVVAVGLGIIYLLTRSARLTIASAGGVIAVPATGMSHKDLVEFVDALEHEKLLLLGYISH